MRNTFLGLVTVAAVVLAGEGLARLIVARPTVAAFALGMLSGVILAGALALAPHLTREEPRP